MPEVHSMNRQDRRGGATQRTPVPGSNGRMNERDNQRILRIALAVVIVVLIGVLAVNAFWLPGTGSSTDAPVPTAPAANSTSPSGAPPATGGAPSRP